MNRERRSRLLLIAVAVIGIFIDFAGCGKNTGRFDYSGQVTFDGTPVPAGEVMFVPDTSRQNGGPGTVALIKDGRYQTPPGKGAVGGPHVVRITGQDGIPVPGGDQHGRALFREYQMKADLPRQSGTYDFAVPAEAKNTLAPPSRRP
jgi:hypothetical protein